MPRADLLALTEDGLMQLANAGLVKRGVRDMAAGGGPSISEAADGLIEARFVDGTLTRLRAGLMPAAADCTCPASGFCRHRVLLVLAYQAQHAAEAAAAAEAWDPGTLDGAGFEAALPGTAKAELARLLASPVPVRLDRGAVPCARLPMATVRFLVPGEIGYARCDCVAVSGCAHVALAVRAFAAAAGSAEVTLGAAPAAVAVADDRVAAADAVLAGLLAEGVVAGMAAHGRALDRARAAAAAMGATWLVLALETLGEQIAGYEIRSALHDERVVLGLAAELYARVRGDAVALGIGEAMETAMAKTRLVSLGARVMAQGRELMAAVLLADTDTGAVMRLQKRFVPGEDEERLTAAAIADRLLLPGLPLRGLAHGQILTSVARRRADGRLSLGSGARGRTALMPRALAQALPSPLLVRDTDAVVAAASGRPPRFLRPRSDVLDVRVFDIAAVLGQSWMPGAQRWQAAVTLAGGGTLYLQRRHDPGAPQALPVLFAAFAGEHGTIRQVAGVARVEGGAVICEPWLLLADQVLVPDIDTLQHQGQPLAVAGEADAVAEVTSAQRFLAGVLHTGAWFRGHELAARATALAASLQAAGYARAAALIAAWLRAGIMDAAAFGQVAVWLLALEEV